MKTEEGQIEGKEHYFVQMAKFLFVMTIFTFYATSIRMFLQLCTCLDNLGV